MSGSGGGMGADQEFLRKMSGHHQGMIAMGEIAQRRGGKEIRAEAEMAMKKQQAEIDFMMGKLRDMGGSAQQPDTGSGSQSMLQKLESAAEGQFETEFRRATIQHHQMGIDMADRYLPKLQQPGLKLMAERMRAVQAAEIREQEQKLAMGM